MQLPANSSQMIQTHVQMPNTEHTISNAESNPTLVPHSQQPKQDVKNKQIDPDKFDGRAVEWRDYIVHFEQVSTWNGWSDSEKAQQLVISLRGQAQKLHVMIH